MDDPLRIIAETTGVFLRREALDCGYDDRALARSLRASVIHRVRHGAYCFADQWAVSTPEERHLIVARGVLRETPGPVAFSHTTALLVHGIATWGIDLRRVHVTRLDGGAARIERDVVHHVWECTDEEVVHVDGLPVVSVPRAVIEAATLGTVESGLVSADSALHHGLCDPDQPRSHFAGMNHWPGSQRIHVVLHHMDGRSETPGEARSRYMFWRQGMPTPELQHHVYDASGALLGVTDFAWIQLRTFGEFDGQQKYHRYLQPGETPGDAVFREKQREDRIRELTGYRMVRLVWRDLNDPVGTAARFWAALRRTT